jgi:ABC-type Fe3+/spermidine/putrescine transport system ATPase subunit
MSKLTGENLEATGLPEAINLQPAHLRLEHLVKSFGPTKAVDDVTLDIPKGSFATLLGPSGCGKTTLLRTIAGFYEPNEGAIYLEDQRIDHLPAHRRGTAMVFQDYALFPHMSVFDNIAYGLRLAKVQRAELDRRVRETVEFVGLQGLEKRWPSQLSGGQQQRVALARALVVQPRVLLLDEPLSNLDANLRERMRWELRSLQQRLNITFVYVTHDQSEALAMSDWIAVIKDGRVMQWGDPWEIYYHPRTTFMAEFVGAANLEPVKIVDNRPPNATVVWHDYRLELPSPGEGTADEALLCIRPEAITISTEPGDPARYISLPGSVTRKAFLGHIMRYWVQVGQAEWIVDESDPGANARPFDGAVHLLCDPHRVHLIVPLLASR